MQRIQFLHPDGCVSRYIDNDVFERQMIAQAHRSLDELPYGAELSLEVLHNRVCDTFAILVVRSDDTAFCILSDNTTDLKNLIGLLGQLGCDDTAINALIDDMMTVMIGNPKMIGDGAMACFDDISVFQPEWN